MKKYFAAAALLLAMTACCGGGNNKPLEGTTWKLVSMPGIPTESITAEEDSFTLMFNADEMMAAGRTNCNRFFGSYELKGKELELGEMGMTRMACPEMEYESLFVEMLDEADRYEIAGEEMKLFDDDVLLATFKAVATPAAE